MGMISRSIKKEMFRLPKNNAFTLLETLLVLFIVSIIFGCMFFPSTILLTKVSEKSLINEIKNNIIHAQLYALFTNKNTKIIFDPHASIFSSSSKEHTLNMVKLNPHLKIFSNDTISFNFSGENGNISKFGSVFLQGDRTKYQFIFQIGKGRFRIEEN